MSQQSPFVRLTHHVRLLITLLFTVYITACASSPSNFIYQVRVEDKATGRPISRAKVTIEVGGIAPLDDTTDTNGLATVNIDGSRAGQLGMVQVEATGFATYSQKINLDKNILPKTIQLEPITAVAPTQAPTQIPTIPATTIPTTVVPATATNTSVPVMATKIPKPTTLPSSPTPTTGVPTSEAASGQIFSDQGVPQATSKPLTVTVAKVEREGTLVQVTVVAVNQGPAYKADLCYYNGCRLIDPSGATFPQQKVSVEGESQHSWSEKVIPSQAPYQFTLSFEGVSADVQQIALLEVRGLGINGHLELRNVPVPYTSP